MIWLHDFDAYELLRRTDYAAYLNLLEDFPLRGFPYQLLDAAYELATTSELCLLLKHARPVFDQNGAWIKQNRVAFIVLNLLAGRILDQPFEDGQPSESFKETLTEIVDALLVRSDATPLAYAWLQRVLMSPGKSRRRSPMKDDANLTEALLLVAANLAPHVGPHPDPLGWIQAELFVWRNWRIYALLAIEICRQPTDKSAIANLIAQTLLRDLASSTGIDRLGGAPNIERRVISLAVAQIPDLANWFTELWKRLFWQRNHFRWLGHNDVGRPNVGQVIALWGLCALELLHASPDEARSLWLAIYDAVHESILMDAFRQTNDAWSMALRFLGALWLKTFPDDPPAGNPGSLEDFITPWRHIDSDFAQLVILDRYGVQPEQLRRTGVSGDMLRKTVEASQVRGRTLLQPQEISVINAVAEKLAGSDTIP